MQYNNLDDVQKYVNTHMDGWRIRRGTQTYMDMSEHTPAENYEVIQLFRPEECMIPFAEFWRGYYEFSPDSYTGFYGPKRFGFSCSGELDFAMSRVIDEHERVMICPKIIKAVEAATEKDEALKACYRPISNGAISKIRCTEWWAVECDNFSCKGKQRCILRVKPEANGTTFHVKYFLETWWNDHYKTDVAKTIVIVLN